MQLRRFGNGQAGEKPRFDQLGAARTVDFELLKGFTDEQSRLGFYTVAPLSQPGPSSKRWGRKLNTIPHRLMHEPLLKRPKIIIRCKPMRYNIAV